eukprot:jgi/Botrbrau1/9586/Bobra.106_2s0010.1
MFCCNKHHRNCYLFLWKRHTRLWADSRCFPSLRPEEHLLSPRICQAFSFSLTMTRECLW